MIVAISEAAKFTFGLGIVFFVVFPLLLHGLVAFSAAQVAGEKAENEADKTGFDEPRG